MSQSLVNIPQARSWREIPQPGKPRAMSREGRWRLAVAALRVAGVAVVAGAFAWLAWLVADVLREDAKALPPAVRAEPVRRIEIKTNGVLDQAWLRAALALPPKASLMELDLERLRAGLLTHGQVNSAALTRKFPDTLQVQLTERSPVVRMMAQLGAGAPTVAFVARDGVVFEGVGLDPAMVNTLPWLDGVTLRRQGDGYAPLTEILPAATLLATAWQEAEHLYRSWAVVSLARLRADREIEVRTKEGSVIVFSADGSPRLQLARLNLALEKLAAAPAAPTRIDLSLGSEVVVTFPTAAGQPSARSSAAAMPSFFFPSQSH